MAPADGMLARRSDGSSTSLTGNTAQIIGVSVAAAIAAFGAIFFGIYLYRKRLSAKREKIRESAFINVRGLVRDGFPSQSSSQTSSSESLPHARMSNPLPRSPLSNSVTMPPRVALRKNATEEEIVQYYSSQGRLPRPFAPFTASNGDSNRLSAVSALRPQSTGSFFSMVSSYSSRRGSTASSLSAFDDGHKRKVRQLFHPTLPDELFLSLGERIAVINSYDDGWCIVGRDSMLKPGDVELGAVPSWVFMKAVKGLRAERPIRTSSLGVTVTLDAPGPRQDVISWSNFS
ncbi:uncharacterized protein LAESUDRAFT_762743 [Laetiporus sulphureus 93-53]|uniref:SH3 domain-containing protein n=1 Tax=Laetiporus sulphureus 93-53 TaxID=1314785 RepID=A0A165CDP3_9APHY|nr:uncharacterized protein LAESUDRAFT_762743 [Laetiporus sulphureus 93-53]KZT02624.1 hypothetical protein LAESUDRAFT_762743 [Laetiporus sulphureus 93-53]